MNKQRIAFLLSCILVMLMFAGCGGSTTEQEPGQDNAEPEIVYFESDELVNQFIGDINDNTDYTVEDISKGNIVTKCICRINDCYSTIIDTTDAVAEYNIEVSVDGGNNQEDTDKMIDTSKVLMKVLDPSLTDDTIDSIISDLLAENYLKEDVEVGENIKITFVPFKELSNGVSTSRIDIHSYTYSLR